MAWRQGSRADARCHCASHRPRGAGRDLVERNARSCGGNCRPSRLVASGRVLVEKPQAEVGHGRSVSGLLSRSTRIATGSHLSQPSRAISRACCTVTWPAGRWPAAAGCRRASDSSRSSCAARPGCLAAEPADLASQSTTSRGPGVVLSTTVLVRRRLGICYLRSSDRT